MKNKPDICNTCFQAEVVIMKIPGEHSSADCKL